MTKCAHCRYTFKNMDEVPCIGCFNHDKFENYHRQTQADRIRAMSDEELVNWISFETASDEGWNHGSEDLIDWLKKEVE